MERKYLIGLDPKEYEHELDRKVLNKLNALSGFEAATNAFLNWSYLKWHIVSLKGGCFQITEESCSELYNQIVDVQKTLDVHPLPSLYTEWEYGINGYTTGYGDDTLMVLKSGAVDILSEEELRFIVGHEFGHIKSKHVMRHMMADLFSDAISSLPIVGKLAESAKYWLMYWNRMSEFTADRAGLLACQNLDVALSAIAKMAGMPSKCYSSEQYLEGFLKQAESFDVDFSDFSDRTIKAISIATSTHPWLVMRASELVKWYNSGEYQRIVDNYQFNFSIFLFD